MTTDNRTNEPTEVQVKLAYLAHLKAPRTRGMDVYGPMRAALKAVGVAPQELIPPTAALTDMLAPIIARVTESGQVGTHGPDCHLWHVECLALAVQRIIGAPELHNAARAPGDAKPLRDSDPEQIADRLLDPYDHATLPEPQRSYAWQEIVAAVRAERDAALAAIERVRAMHVRHKDTHKPDPSVINGNWFCCGAVQLGAVDPYACIACDSPEWPCPTVAALDGAPEPEEKP